MNNICVSLTVICLCFLSFTGRAQDIRVSEMSYDSVRARFYVTLENHTDRIVSLVPYKWDFVLDEFDRNKNFKNLTYAAFRLKDKNGRVIESADRYAIKQEKGFSYQVFPMGAVKHKVTGTYPVELRTFYFELGPIPEQAYYIEADIYIKLFRLGEFRDRYVLKNPVDGYVQGECNGDLYVKPYYEKKVSKTFKLYRDGRK